MRTLRSDRWSALRRGIPLFLVLAAGLATPALGQRTVRLKSQACATGSDVVVPISVTPADGVTVMDFSFTYNAVSLTPLGAFRSGYSNGFALTSNLATAGQVVLHLSGGPALVGSGEVAWVLFHAAGPAPSATSLTWTSASLNGGALAVTTQNGSIQILSPQVRISAPDGASGAPASQVQIPIAATAFSGADSFDIDVQFNPAVLSAFRVDQMPLTQSMQMASNVSAPGIVRIALFGTAPVSGAGELVRIVCNVTGALGARTPLDVTRGQIHEGAIPTTLDDGFFTVCVGADGDGDGFSSCAGDCNDANPSVYPGATEACDGLDNNCDGTADNVPIPGGIPIVGLSKTPPTALMSWTAIPGASGYDVVRGSLSVLRASGGNFATATETCLANNQVGTSLPDAAMPPSNNGFWYLVRGENCGRSGTYDSGAPSQVGLRDAEIQASPFHCL